MTPSRATGHAEDPLSPDDFDGHSHPDHERSTLLRPGQVHPEEDEDEDHAREVLSWKRLPWWKRPSPYWLFFGTLISSTGLSSILAPKVALYTSFVCRVHKPEYTAPNKYPHSFAFPLIHNISETAVDAVYVFLPNSTYTASSDYTQYGSDSQQKCASDPVVQAVVARLNAVVNTATGILSCLTTSWWGSLSDRYGRRTVLLVSVFGLFVTDIIHVITAWFLDVLPGGYWFVLVGQLIDGLCGSLATGSAAGNAYVADTTDPSTRSQYFSLSLGLMFTGVAVGPLLGGILIQSTGNVLSVFYFASILHGVYTIVVLCIVPESLTRARARGARLRRRQGKENQTPNNRALGVFQNITRFFSPLVVLLPEQSLNANPLKQGRDWSLFFIAIACGLNTSILGSISNKFQYAAAQFNWTPEVTSYFFAFIGVTRAFFLTAILPLIIKYYKPTPVQVAIPDELPPGACDISPSRGASSSARTSVSEHRLPASRSPAFDLALARVSEVLESTAFLSMATATTGTFFTLASAIGSFASGFSPAAQALALDIYTNRRPENRGEVGKLFGALNVVLAFAGQIASPALYGFVYSNTVATFPQAILVMSMCTSLLALTCLLFVRIPSKLAGDLVTPGHENEEGNQDVETHETAVAIEGEAVERR